ncbi:MAG: coiled coil domain-containing protein [Proteobacteria bacterium]|nr:coiled coil domain-containing protein [Pseudomonadota bacterium]
MEDKQKTFAEKFDTQLHEWNAQIALLIAEADKAKKAEEKEEYYTKIKLLQHKRHKAAAQLLEFQTADYEAWEDLKEEAEKAWSEVRRPFTWRS